MSCGGRQVGWGKYPKWTANIHPFRDRPDVPIPVVFYPVPDDAPPTPPTVFTDRFWDVRDYWMFSGVGLDPASMRPYFGPVPAYRLFPPIGTRDQWANGCLFSEYIAGRYSNPEPCIEIVSPGGIHDTAGIVIDETQGD